MARDATGLMLNPLLQFSLERNKHARIMPRMPNFGKKPLLRASSLSALLVANLRRQQPPELFRQFARDNFSTDRPNGSVMPEKCVFGFLMAHLCL